MDEAFVIMQIGDAQMDDVYENVFESCIESNGLAPRRVDKHNSGELLKSEIVQFIERSRIIIADVTNERPNCYLEIGYAMGLGRVQDLILTARNDHHHSNQGFSPDGPKVHFDLEGYDILFWDPEDLVSFADALRPRIERRMRIPRKQGGPASHALATAVSDVSTPGGVHDVVLNLVRESDHIGLNEFLRGERARFDSAISRVESEFCQRPQPSVNRENLADAWNQILPAAERRLASLLPLCIYDGAGFESEVANLARVLSNQPPRDGFVAWQEIGKFATAWIGYVCGALAVATERFESVTPLAKQVWRNQFRRESALVSIPGTFSGDLGNALAAKDSRWLSPTWEYLVQSVGDLDWLLERHQELEASSEPRASLAIFDALLCLYRGKRGQRSTAYAALGGQGVPAFVDRLQVDTQLRSRIAEFVGVSLDEFDANASEWFESSDRFNGGFDSFDEIAHSLRRLDGSAD